MNSRIPFTLLPLAALMAGVFNSSVLFAEEEELEKITVTATRAERDINEIAANITVIDWERIDALSANNIRDLLRYEPGVSVEGSGRYGLSDFNVRGINGDRVLIVIDGVPIVDEFSFGPNLSARRDFVDVDLIKGVEVIRGPASTLYGSDAIGGVVAFVSKDPIDMLDKDESFAGRVKVGYVSQSEESYINGQLAGVAGDWQWLINAGYREGSETESFYDTNLTGPAQQSANPLNNEVDNALVKLIWTPNEMHKLTIIGETFSADTDVNITSDIGVSVFGFANTRSTGQDERERDRVSVHYRYQPKDSSLHRFSFNAYSQSSSTDQHAEVTRVSEQAPGVGFDRTRDSMFEQDTQGILTQADFQFSGFGDHYLIAGIEWQETDSEALRTGQSTNFDGSPFFEFSVFPARDFPISTMTELAFYVQDEIQLLDNQLIISPGIRYDSFDLEAKIDDIFTNANPGVEVRDYDDSEFVAKLGAVYNVTQDANVWLQWAQGFRIPPMDDLNVGFTNFGAGYTSLANPDLVPENVDSIEIGWRQSIESFSFSVSAYINDYENFIESLAVRGFNADTGLLEFQSRNIEDAEIKGIDISASWANDEWQIRLATSLQNSEDKATGQELETVLPAQTVLGVQYGQYDDPWRVELVGTYVEAANAFPDPNGAGNYFVAPSATIVDLLAHYQVSDNIRVNAGIFNITDKKYWYASEVRGRGETNSALDRLTAPGTNFSANLIVNF